MGVRSTIHQVLSLKLPSRGVVKMLWVSMLPPPTATALRLHTLFADGSASPAFSGGDFLSELTATILLVLVHYSMMLCYELMGGVIRCFLCIRRTSALDLVWHCKYECVRSYWCLAGFALWIALDCTFPCLGSCDTLPRH